MTLGVWSCYDNLQINDHTRKAKDPDLVKNIFQK